MKFDGRAVVCACSILLSYVGDQTAEIYSDGITTFDLSQKLEWMEKGKNDCKFSSPKKIITSYEHKNK